MVSMRVEEAIEKARGFFVRCGGLENEPKANRQQILLRELEHALGLLTGAPEKVNVPMIHAALISGELIGETLGECVIAKEAWPRTTNEQGSHWFVSVPSDDAVMGMRGELIFIPRRNAVAWLTSKLPQKPAHRPDKRNRAAELIALEWPDGIYPSRKVIIRTLKEKHGLEVGDSTVGNALSDIRLM